MREERKKKKRNGGKNESWGRKEGKDKKREKR